jgi:peptide chain release factor 1
MSLHDKFRTVLARHEELSAELATGKLTGEAFTRASKEYADLSGVAEAISEWRKALKEKQDLQALLSDPEMKKEAEAELFDLNKRLPELERSIQLQLLPRDEADDKNAILEVRAGTGGEEAALFAASLFEMYKRYAAVKGWRFEVLDVSESDLGGLKEASAEISGRGVFARLKFESGVHRVQRVPKTEAQGRVHTSAATVAVLPEAEEVDMRIDDKDLQIDVMRAGGAGGQHVNKTESAVRITHLPTGIVVKMQDERSQFKNKAKAMKILRSRLYEQQHAQLASVRAAERKSQVGSGDRSERIRTYNFPQGRVTDHRVNITLYQIDDVMNGTALDEILEALITEDQASRLAEFGNS